MYSDYRVWKEKNRQVLPEFDYRLAKADQFETE